MHHTAVFLFSHVTGLENCLPGNWAANRVYYWVPGIILESVLFLFVCLKLIQATPAGEGLPGLLTILVRDSMLSYGGALVFLIINAVVYATARVSIVMILCRPLRLTSPLQQTLCTTFTM